MPKAANRATSVQPNFARARRPTAATNAAAAGCGEAGQRAAGGVGELERTPSASAGEHLAHVRQRLRPRRGRGRSGS